MKITKTLLLSLLTIVLLSCKNDDEEILIALPTITTITPNSVTIGSPLIINGSNFSSDLSLNKVRFFHDEASFDGIVTNADMYKLNTSIPASLAPGEYSVEVTVDGNSVIASRKIVVQAMPSIDPSISSIAPVSGQVGSELVISGLNFSIIPHNNRVNFVKEDNTIVNATIISFNSTSLKVKVPETTPGIYSIGVEVGENILYTSTKYTIKPSVIVNSFSPASGEKGSDVTIYGSNFSLTKNENTVYFISDNNIFQTTVLAATASSLKVEVPGNILLGNFIIKVAVNGNSSSANSPFSVTPTVLPTITTFSTSNVYSGATLTINGADFDTHIDFLQVVFVNGTHEEKSMILNATYDYITLIVPALADGNYNLKVYKYGEPVISSKQVTSDAAAFSITDFTAKGSSIQINGSGFKTAKQDNIVEFVQADTSIPSQVINASGDALEVLVPESLKGRYYIKVTIDSKSVTLADKYFAL